jgi:hypothetical protein
VSLAIICVDDDNGREKLSIELEILLLAVEATSVGDEDVVLSMDVANDCDIDDDDRYSLEIEALSLTLIVFSLVLLEIPFVVAEIN